MNRNDIRRALIVSAMTGILAGVAGAACGGAPAAQPPKVGDPNAMGAMGTDKDGCGTHDGGKCSTPAMKAP